MHNLFKFGDGSKGEAPSLLSNSESSLFQELKQIMGLRLSEPVASFVPMSSVPATAEEWLAEALSQDHAHCSLCRLAPYHHHKDYIGQLEPISQAPTGDIPFGGLTKPL
jgi:hypothetical protein